MQNNKGQAVLSEYVIIFFVAVAAMAAITVFMQRALEARIHDTRNFMFNAIVSNSEICDANCLNAAGGQILPEYEPYYTQMVSDVTHNEQTDSRQTTGNPAVIGAIYYNAKKEKTSTISTSAQLPPCASANPVPAWCNN